MNKYEVAASILSQIGGKINGTSSFEVGENTLSFRTKGTTKVRAVVIKLEANDTYSAHFVRLTEDGFDTITETYSGLHAEDLSPTLSELCGLPFRTVSFG